MKIVIDMPKEMYINALNGYLCGSKTIVNAIENGTPLPKGHGRLIDADALIEQIKKSRCTGCDNYNGVRCRACQYDDEMADIEDAPTIIEADKESD